MGKISFCFGIYGDTTINGTGIPTEEIYESTYKKIASFLYENKDFQFSFFFPGLLLEWLQKNHEEFLIIIEELLSRKQVEVLGGGFHNPQFPLLQPADRAGQLELLTTALRKTFSKRPRGCWVNEGVWDPSLISSLNSCGLEYVLLDYSIVANPESGFSAFAPAITEELGKSVFVLPVHTDMLCEHSVSAQSFFEHCEHLTQKTENAVICCFISAEKASQLFASNWFDQFKTAVLAENSDKAELSLPSKIMKTGTLFNKIIIPSGLNTKTAAWTQKPYKKVSDGELRQRNTVRNFILLYPEVLNLYSRMNYTALLISQCRGDKARKKAAREELWKAQNGAAYWYIGSGGFADSGLRNDMYKYLLQAERLVRETASFVEAVNSFDFNADGLREYIAQFAQYNAFVTRKGGMIFEFDVLPCARNFTNTVSEDFQRKLFSDYLVSEKDFRTLASGKQLPPFVCLNDIVYSEVKFDRVKKDIKLEAVGTFEKKHTIKILKEYHFTKDSIRVDYRLINTSKDTINAYFAVENTLCMQSNAPESLIMESSANDLLVPFSPETTYYEEDDIFNVRMSDLSSHCVFTVSSSDPSGLYAYPFYSQQQYAASVSGLFWPLSLLPGAVFSRTITLYLKVTKKSKKAAAAKN